MYCLPHLILSLCQKAPKKAKKRAAEGANSNVFSMFEQAQIQEFKEVKAAQPILILHIYIHTLCKSTFTYKEIRIVETVWICMSAHYEEYNDLRVFYLTNTLLHIQSSLSSSLFVLLCLSISIVHHRSMSTCLFSCPRLGSSKICGMLAWESVLPRHPDFVISD